MPKYLALATLLLLFTGCTDVLEEDLDGSGVVLQTPPAAYTTTLNTIAFRWDVVPNATRYQLQVCTPDFTVPVAFALDSAVTGVSFNASFAPGDYTWRVRAENDNSHTDWYSRTFTITSSQTLTGQVPVLVSPMNNFVSDTNALTFVWDTLPFTDDHRFELRQVNETGPLIQALITPESTISLNNLADGRYAWGVQAQNAVPSTSSITYRLFTVDITTPSSPLQLAPASGANVPQAPFTFLWQSGQDALTDTRDSLIVRNSVLQVIRAISTANGTYADSLGPGTYTWLVKTLDEAGNYSTAGPIPFTVP
jgi:hypothetical protein